MNWLTDYWFWLLLIGGFVGLHLAGHRFGFGGCCGSHKSAGSHKHSAGDSVDAGNPPSHRA